MNKVTQENSCVMRRGMILCGFLVGVAVTSFGEMTISQDMTLTGDTDWSQEEKVTIEAGVTVALNGHRLTVKNLDGTGRIENVHRFRFFRYIVDAVQNDGDEFQIGRFQLFSFDEDMTSKRINLIYDPNTNFEMHYPEVCLDDNLEGKWFDNRKDKRYFILDYGEPILATRYMWYTGDDSIGYSFRTPKSWKLQGSNDEGNEKNWTDLDVVVNWQDTTTKNYGLAWDKSVLTSGPRANLVFTTTAGETVDVPTGVEIMGAITIVKQGGGTVQLPDTYIANVKRVEVNEGLLNIYRTGSEADIHESGEIYIAQNAHLNVNMQYNKTTFKGPLTIAENVALKLTGMTSDGGTTMPAGAKFDTMDIVNGYLNIYTESLTGAEFTSLNLTSESGSFDIRPQANGIVNMKGAVTVNKTGGTMYVYGPNNSAEHGMALELHGFVQEARIGLNYDRAGTLELKPGSDITFNTLRIGHEGGSPSAGRVIVDAGAKLTVETFNLGEWSGTPNSNQTHKFDVFGEVEVLNKSLYVAFDAPRTEMTMGEGSVVRTKGLQIRNNNGYGSGRGAGDGHHVFRQEGGRLEMGEVGFQCESRPIPGVSRFDIQNGEVVNTAAYGVSDGNHMFFGYDKLGGSVTYDLGVYSVDWNTAIAGASDLTIKGSADFKGDRWEDRAQGAMLGKVTVENTGLNDLKPISVFGGGLKLTNGAHVQVANYGDTKFLYSIVSSDVDAANGSAWGLDYTSADFFPFFHKYLGDQNTKPFSDQTGVMCRGEFYVPAEKAGVWSFIGQYDDYVSIYIDDSVVFSVGKGRECQIGTGSRELGEGWHTFSIYGADSGGGSGAGLAENTMTIGFHVGETSSQSASDYVKFAPGASLGDGASLQIRPYANACVWSFQNGNGNWDTTENWSHVKVMKSVDYMHKYANMSDSGNYSKWFSGKANKFEGWMKVEAGQEGEWTFKMGYDDNKMLVIDGDVLIRQVEDWQTVFTAKKTLARGWHRWEVRVQDGSGGWGPNGVNNYNTLSYIAPGEQEEEKQFNETNLKLAATLGDISVLERTGIYRELDVGEGAEVVSSGTEPMSIFGTLKGKGALSGEFAFAGDASEWEVEGVGARSVLTSCAVFNDATADTFRGLARVKALFDTRPLMPAYELANAPTGLTTDDLANVATTVKDADGNDYSDAFSVRVKNGKIVLANARPSGVMIYIR